MTQANRVHSTPPTNTPTSRRGFLGGTAAALAAGTAVNVVALATRPAAASSPDDSALLKLEEQYFEQHDLAHAYDDEMNRLAWIWTDRYRELHEASVLGHNTLNPQERADIVAAMPECIEHTRLGKLQDPHYARMDAIVREMWPIPAHTPEGRRAKVLVALDMLPSDWRELDKDCDYGILETRQLLFELVGGEPGAELRDQFRGDECA